MIKTAYLLIFTIIAFSCTETKKSIIYTYEKLHNSHDIESEMLMYHEDIKFELRGTWIKSGKEKIRELAVWDSVLNSNLKFEILRINNDSLICKVTEENDWFKAVGIEQIIHDPTIFIVKNDLIMDIIANPSAEVGKQISDTIGSIYAWSNMTQDSTINELIIDGEFIYSAETAKKWLNLFEKWKRYKEENDVE